MLVYQFVMWFVKMVFLIGYFLVRLTRKQEIEHMIFLSRLVMPVEMTRKVARRRNYTSFLGWYLVWCLLRYASCNVYFIDLDLNICRLLVAWPVRLLK